MRRRRRPTRTRKRATPTPATRRRATRRGSDGKGCSESCELWRAAAWPPPSTLLPKHGVLEVFARSRIGTDPRGQDRVRGRLARERPLHLAVDLDRRPGSGHVRQHEAVAFRDRLHPTAERVESALHLGRGILRVLLEALVPRVAHLILADAVEEVHDLAARRVGAHDRLRIRVLRPDVETADVDLDEELLA